MKALLSKAIPYLILLIAFSVRLGYVYSVAPGPPLKETPDALHYDGFAQSVLTHGEYTYSGSREFKIRRPPVYPLFLAAIYKVFGHSLHAVRVIQVLINVLTCYLIYLMSMKLFHHRGAALLAMLAYAVYVPVWIYTALILTEILFSLIMAVFMLVYLDAFAHSSTCKYVAAGIILGIGVLCRPTPFYYPIVGYLLVVLAKNKFKYVFQHSLMYASMLLIILPWAIRNYQVSGQVVPVSTISGTALVDGLIRRPDTFIDNSDITGLGKTDGLEIPVEEEMKLSLELGERLNGKSEVEENHIKTQFSLGLIKKYPLKYITLIFKKLPRLWLNVGFSHKPSKKSFVIAIGHFIIIGFALFGYLKFGKDMLIKTAPILLILAYFTLVHLVTVSYIKYILPLMPYMIILFSYSVTRFFHFDEVMRKHGVTL